jgi:hypothetical protein
MYVQVVERLFPLHVASYEFSRTNATLNLPIHAMQPVIWHRVVSLVQAHHLCCISRYHRTSR